ncbi:hypothetical protein [Erythrobacter sp. HL-111]|uniref:hypothetical protein n=1 Tax=Erythrobacter sp. HL-111 TaxID=1798193 RepID=UPI0006DB0CA3|nr:hypothetical protein [Erythrobacter sp. HL-111]KPP85098.1 MAG: hypothetical protein HLUCCO15_13620 [Erythrobacteraceae bacterium HL-111]SDS17275.1 hypothetical protein SAMN04515621_1083 [Erythrobacter sp. HL-111]
MTEPPCTCPDPPDRSLPKRNKRKIARQATSEVAWEFEPAVVSDEDPLLAFAPYLHKQPRRNSITPDLQRAFVARLAETGVVKAAAIHIGRSLEALYKLRRRPGAEGFAAAWDEALEWGALRLEDCAIERVLAEGLSNRRANSMLAFLIRHRRAPYLDPREVGPGHPLYERIRREIEEENRARANDPAEIARVRAWKLEIEREVRREMEERAAQGRAPEG